MNFWSWVLTGYIYLIQVWVMPLFGNANDQMAALNFGGAIGNNFSIVFQLLWITFSSVFNLTWFGIYIAFALTMKLIQIVVAIYMFIKSLIPFVN